MHDTDFFSLAVERGVAHLQLNRPERHEHDGAGRSSRRCATRCARLERRRRNPRAGDLVHRQALLRRHGPVGVHRRGGDRGSGQRRGRPGDADGARVPAPTSCTCRRRSACWSGRASRLIRGDPGRLHRRRGRLHQRLRHPLRQRRRLLPDPGDQHRHDRRRRHLPPACAKLMPDGMVRGAAYTGRRLPATEPRCGWGWSMPCWRRPKPPCPSTR